MQTTPRATGTVGILPVRVAGALAYVTFLPAIIFLLVKPYDRNTFVRFHSIQCLAVWAVALVFVLVLKLASYIVFLVPIVGPLLIFVLSVLGSLAALFLWMALLIKAVQGELFHVPYIGSFAEQYAKVAGEL